MTGKRAATTTAHGDTESAAPLSDEEFNRGHAAILARRARSATGLSQTAFATRYGIPAASLRDWEQGRRAPDAATRSYLRVIARMPDLVAQALNDAA